MERSQFTFYESFFRAVSRIRKAADRAAAYDAICAYALYGTDPDMDKLPDAAAIAFEVARPNLDASRRKASNGKRGGEYKKPEANKSNGEANGSKPEANVSKQEANMKQEQDKEQEKEEEKDKDKEQMLSPVAPFAAVMSAYMDKINPQPSETCIGELKGFTEHMGAEVCLRAINIAMDERKTSWSYIRAILMSKQSRGVKCLADWDRLEEGRKRRGAGEDSNTAEGYGGDGSKWNVKSAIDDCD